MLDVIKYYVKTGHPICNKHVNWIKSLCQQV